MKREAPVAVEENIDFQGKQHCDRHEFFKPLDHNEEIPFDGSISYKSVIDILGRKHIVRREKIDKANTTKGMKVIISRMYCMEIYKHGN